MASLDMLRLSQKSGSILSSVIDRICIEILQAVWEQVFTKRSYLLLIFHVTVSFSASRSFMTCDRSADLLRPPKESWTCL